MRVEVCTEDLVEHVDDNGDGGVEDLTEHVDNSDNNRGVENLTLMMMEV
jgi:hypothetical protein